MRIAAVSAAYAPRDVLAGPTRATLQKAAERVAVDVMPTPVPTTPEQVLALTGKGMMVDVIC